MLHGANLIWSGKREWQNPYITDGLVAMWDGEWNAGGGVHDPNATVWKDLIGNVDLALTNLGTFQDNCLFNAKGGIGAIGDKVIDGAGSLEVVFSRTGWNKYQTTFFVYCGPRYKFCQRNGIANGNSIGQPNYGIDNTLTITARNAASWSVVTPMSGTGSIYYNSSKQSISIGSARGAEAPEYASVVSEQFDSSFYSIRVYNRNLTEAEIAANYAIDKARFGLP